MVHQRLLPGLLLCTRIEVSKINFFFLFGFFFFVKGIVDAKSHGPIAHKPSVMCRRAVGSVSPYCLDSHYLEMLRYSPESSLRIDLHLLKAQLSGILYEER